MRNANQAFRKDIEDTKRRLDDLNNKKYSLKVDAEIAKNNLNEARKALRNAEEETQGFQRALDRLNEAHFNQDQIANELKNVSAAAKQAEKDLNALADSGSKRENRAGGPVGQGGILSQLAGAGATKMIGDLLSNAAGTYVGSAFGNTAGTYLDSVLSSGSMGAAIGTAIAPGIGTAIGAALGGVAGLVEGSRKVFESQDTAFKAYTQNLYTEATGAQLATRERGTGIAAQREMDFISFETLLGGAEKARDFLNQVVDFAAVTPFDYGTLTDISKTLLAYGYKQEEIVPLLTNIGNTGATLGLSTEDMNAVAVSLGRMEVSGKTTMRYLQPLLDRGIDVWKYLAEASGNTKEEVIEMVSKGLVPGAEAARALAEHMGAASAGGMERQAQTFSGLVSTLSDAQEELDNAMGASYTEKRKKGLAEQIGFLEGPQGDSMKEAYAKMGQWQGYLENLKEEMQRDAMTAVMTGAVPLSLEGTEAESRLAQLAEEYAQLSKDSTEEAGAKMGALLARAQAIAVNAYNASDGAKLQLETQIGLANSIKEDASLNRSYWDAGYQMGEQFSRGMMSAQGKLMGLLQPSGIVGSGGEYTIPDLSGPAYAYGLDRVPYNNYAALLHEGERVLTAGQAREVDRGGASKVEVKVYGLSVREEADIGLIAQALAQEIQKAHILQA